MTTSIESLPKVEQTTHTSPMPFTLCFVEKFDDAFYNEASRASVMLSQSYDPKTQTSQVGPEFGTVQTVNNTMCGSPFLRVDDSSPSDS